MNVAGYWPRLAFAGATANPLSCLPEDWTNHDRGTTERALTNAAFLHPARVHLCGGAGTTADRPALVAHVSNRLRDRGRRNRSASLGVWTLAQESRTHNLGSLRTRPASALPGHFFDRSWRDCRRRLSRHAQPLDLGTRR